MDSATISELEQEVADLRGRVLQVAAEVKGLLAEDLPRFVERELKDAFVHNPDFANTISDDKLRTLKADIAAKATSGTTRVLAALNDDNLWFPEGPVPSNRKSIAEHAALWAIVSEICATVAELYSTHNFPAPAEPTTYKAPTWFIGRRYLPSLSEKYWRHVEELQEKQSAIGSIQNETSTTVLTQRWDEVDDSPGG